MKIGITSAACLRYGADHYNRIKMLGYETIDYSMANTENELYNMQEGAFLSFLQKEKEVISTAGLEISQVHGPWRYPPRDLEKADMFERMETMKKSIRATAALGCKNWVIHPLMPYGVEDLGTENQEKTWNINLKFFKELLKEAVSYDVTICLENMPFLKFSLSTPKQILAFVKEMNDEKFKICLDTGHVNVFNGKTVADAVRLFGNSLRVMHCHDNMGNGDSHSMPHFGTIDWKEYYKALCEIGFVGSFSLECSPPAGLSDEMYWYMSKGLYNIAKEIVSGE